MNFDLIREQGTWLLVILMIAFTQHACQPEVHAPLIVIETGDINEIGPTQCKIHGEIQELGQDGIVQHGFVWSETRNPDVESGDKNELGAATSTGSFSSTITGLAPNTIYHVRAYATGGDQTTYGMEKIFTTSSPTIPSLHSMPAFYVGTNSAAAGGRVISDGGAEITARGVCWSTHTNPRIDDNCTNDGTGSGSFESDMNYLEPYTVYFFRAYATNSLGTAYGEKFGFKTLWDNSVITDIDGNEYATVQIGDRVWMAENLKTVRYSDGDPIPFVETMQDWMALSSNAMAYSYYGNSDVDLEIYGALYTWAAAMKGAESSNEAPSEVEGVCPSGWHLPSDTEWKELELHLGMTELTAKDDGWRGWDEGGMLKETGTELWLEPNEMATNESGFTALPGGFRDADGTYGYAGSFTSFWSTTGYDADGAWIRGLHTGRGEILRDVYPRKNGFSVRCIKDD